MADLYPLSCKPEPNWTLSRTMLNFFKQSFKKQSDYKAHLDQEERYPLDFTMHDE